MNTNTKTKRRTIYRATMLLALISLITFASTRLQADTGSCAGVNVTLPFTDVAGSGFYCQIASAYFSGLSNGTSATTFSPGDLVSREQMAAFISRAMDQSLKRGSRRAVAKKWWTPQTVNSLTLTTVGDRPQQVEFDGTDLWVANLNSGTVTKVRPSDGKVIATWTGATEAYSILAAMGKIFIVGATNPGCLYMIDPTVPAGAVTTLTSNLGNATVGMAFDGSRIWTTNNGGGGSVSIVSLNPTTVTTVSTGFNAPTGILFDGSNIWVADTNAGNAGTLLKLNSNGSIAHTINMEISPLKPVFDGANIWVPNQGSDTLAVVRVKDATGNPLATPFVLATLTGNGLNGPRTAAFDGERILIGNLVGDSVSLWKAADLTPLGFLSTGVASDPNGVCSDGLNFWIALGGVDKLARF